MPRPTSKVELHNDAINKIQLFSFVHAQNLLILQERKKYKQKGYSVWELPENSKFYFENGSLRKRSNSGANKAEAEKG